MLEYFTNQLANAREKRLLEIKGKYLTEEQKQDLAKEQLGQLSSMDGRLVKLADEIAGLRADAPAIAEDIRDAAIQSGNPRPFLGGSAGVYEPEIVAAETILANAGLERPKNLGAELVEGEQIVGKRKPVLGDEKVQSAE